MCRLVGDEIKRRARVCAVRRRGQYRRRRRGALATGIYFILLYFFLLEVMCKEGRILRVLEGKSDLVVMMGVEVVVGVDFV